LDSSFSGPEVVEELFYRGYAIERLRMIGLGRFWSVTISLVIFRLPIGQEGWRMF
jgi:hypothetical protein